MEKSGIVFEKLSGKNYSHWSFRMKMFLEKEGCWDVVVGEKPVNVAEADWVLLDKKAMWNIGLCVDNSQLIHIKNSKTSREAWSALKKYHAKVTLSSKVSLIKKLFKAQLPKGGNMEEHLLQMFQWLDELNEMGAQFAESLTVIIILSSLNEDYDTLITALEARNDEDLQTEFIRTKLIEEWEKKGKSGKKETALKVGRNPKFQPKCYFCKKEGHLRAKCPEYKKWKTEQESNEHSKTKKPENAKIVHANTEFALTTGKFGSGWLLDSGASCHISCDKRLFTEINPSVKEQVTTASGESISSSGKGIAKISLINDGKERIFPVKDVLYVPEMEGNLLSVRKLTEKGLKLIFEENLCKIYRDREIIGHAVLENGLYKMKEGHQVLFVRGQSDVCVHEWHRRLAHRDIIQVKRMSEYGLKFLPCNCGETCESCLKGKMSRSPFPIRSEISSKQKLDLIHSDVCGPFQVDSPSGNRYVVTFIDDYSRYTVLYLIRHKSEVKIRFREYVENVKTKFGVKPKKLRSDNGGEYIDKELQDYLKSEGIEFQHTVAYTPQQNGVAERKNRYLVEAVRCMLIDSRMEKCFWGEAICTANFVQNRVVTKATGCTPFERWFDSKPNFDNFRIFGENCAVWIPKEKRKKLDDTSVVLKFVGYDEEAKAYRLVDPETKKITLSRDVSFLKTSGGTLVGKKTDDLIIDLNASNNSVNQNVDSDNENEDEFDSDSDGDFYGFEDESFSNHHVNPEVNVDNLRRSQRATAGVRPGYLNDYVCLSGRIQEEPRTLEEVMRSPDRDKWVEAMNEELKAIKANDTWSLVDLPQNKKAIGTKWVFKLKRDTDGNINRYKARLVAQGYSQKYGEDFDEVFAPTARVTSFRALLAVAAKKRFVVKHYDIKTAFLNGDIEEEVYIKQPPGFEKGNKVCRLQKCLYGLKQAARCWNKVLDDFLLKIGFRRSKTDRCLYIFGKPGQEKCFVLVHVDDMVMASNDENFIKEVASKIAEKFEVVSLGDIKQFLGMKVERDDKGDFYLNQKSYIDKIVQLANLSDAKHSNVPVDVGYHRSADSEALGNNKEYQKLIGLLLYVSTNSRPDVSAAVSILSQRSSSPTVNDLNEVKRVIRYLNGTSEKRLRISDCQDEHGLYAYSDANWAEDRNDRKSNSGYVIKLHGGTVSWACRKQSCVSLSTCESEYIALAETCQEVIWLRSLCKDLGIDLIDPTIINEDNQSCIKLVENEKFSNRTKHIDTRYHFVRDLKENGIIKLQYCCTELNVADLLTKPLGASRMDQMRKFVGIL